MHCTTETGTVHILLVDDTEAVRRALRLTLSAEPDFAVVGEAADGETAVALAVRLRPDIILMDLELPRCNGIEATRRITSGGCPSRVIMLTAFGGAERRKAAAEAGVALFLEKGDNLDDLPEQIRTLHQRHPAR